MEELKLNIAFFFTKCVVIDCWLCYSLHIKYQYIYMSPVLSFAVEGNENQFIHPFISQITNKRFHCFILELFFQKST